MTNVVNVALDHRRTVLLALLFILIGGWLSYAAIPKEAEPDVEIPVIYVLVSHEGISPEDAERLLVRPLEQALRAIEGISEMTASAYEGGASVTLEFDAGVATAQALADVREKVDSVAPELPEDTDEPSVHEVEFSRMDPMLVINISGEVPERTLLAIVRTLEDRIESLPGVLDVETSGEREELMEVLVDPLAMESYGISPAELFRLVDRNNRLVAAGVLDSGFGRFPVKVPGVFESPDDVLNLPVKVDGEHIVRFRDVATVRRGFKDPDSYARIDGRSAIGLEVIKRSGANIIETIEQVRILVDEERAQWPAAVYVTYSRDKSRDVRTMLTDLENNVLSAVLLVFIVIVGILGFRSALLVGIAIPGSFLTAILVLSATGMTINIVVLFSLIMAVGMLVDGAIVVVELADRRMAEGLHPREAYAGAARRMAWPIIASTATTVAAFLPLVFWPGVTGEFMKFLPLTLIATLSASLLMALIFVPALGSLVGRSGARSKLAQKRLATIERGNLDELGGFTGAYVAVLRRALSRPVLVLVVMAAILVGIYVSFSIGGRGVEFFPDVEPEFASVEVRARGDLSLDEKDRLMRAVEARILGVSGFESVYTRTGTGSSDPEDLIGRSQVQFAEWNKRRPADEILAEVRERTADLPGLVIETRTPRNGPPGGDKPIEIELSASDPQKLAAAIASLRATLDGMPGLQDVEDSRSLPGIEWRVLVDRTEAARFDADVTAVGYAVQLVTNGIKIGEYRPDDSDEQVDIRVRYSADSRSLDRLDQLRVPTARGLVPISNFVTREAAQRTGTIERSNMRRTLSVAANVAPGVLVSEKVAELRDLLPTLQLDPSVQIRFRGDDEDQIESQRFLQRAMLFAVALIAVILVTQFNSFFQAFLILTAVLFSTGGVLLGHLLFDLPFGVVMSGIGVIALAGIVVNNNIVLLDTFNRLRADGEDPAQAVLRTCALRLRPVLLTTVTTVLGLLPMVFGINFDLIGRHVTLGGPSAQWWTQLASSVAGGLAFATLLTLLLTPALLTIGVRMARRRAPVAPLPVAS